MSSVIGTTWVTHWSPARLTLPPSVLLRTVTFDCPVTTVVKVPLSCFKGLDRRLPSVTDGAFNALQAQLARLMPATLSAPVARLAIRPGRKK